jgi:hypothetical protein
MPLSYGRSRYVLPQTVNPSGRVCYVVPVPDDKQHIAAFLGQIYDLAWSKSWQSDPTHKAADVSRVWQDIFDELIQGPCEVVNIRLKPTDFCTIQLTTDGGVTWVDVADLSACANAAVVAGIQTAIDDGVLAPQGQLGQGAAPSPGSCVIYHVQVDGVGAWHCPIPLSDGDEVITENVNGAWCAGPALLNLWYCPNGQQFVLGACADPPIMDGADPLVTQPHMRFIAGYGPTPTYVDAFDATITIPVGSGNVDFWLQPNDSVQADNFGSVSAKVTVCKSLWTHTFNFLVADGGFSTSNPIYTHQWTSGVGWETTSAQPGMDLVRTVPGNCNIIHAEMHYHCDAFSGPDRNVNCYTYLSPTQNLFFNVTPLTGDQVISGSGSLLNPAILHFTLIPGHTGNYGKVTSLIVRGTGLDPF